MPLTLASVLLSGCTSLRTSREPVGDRSYQSDSKGRVGIYYFLPKALLTVECTKGSDGNFVVVVSRKMVADQRSRYFLRWTQNPFYTDKVTSDDGIATNSEGLLTSVDISTSDQSLNALGDLVNTAVNVFKIMGEGAQAGSVKVGTHFKPLAPFKYTFDPLDRAETDEVVGAIKQFGIVVNACPVNRGTQSCIGEELSANDAKAAALAPAETGLDHPRSGGVFFHPPTTVELRFDFRPAGAEVIQREALLVPDPARVACFRFGRSPFVTRDTTLKLTDGMPTAFKISRDSTLKAATSALSTISGAIATAIPSIVNVQINRETNRAVSQQGLLEARTKLLQDQQALLTAQQAAAKAATTSSTGGAQSGNYADPNAQAPNFQSGGGADLGGGAQAGSVRKRAVQPPPKVQGTGDLPMTDPKMPKSPDQ